MELRQVQVERRRLSAQERRERILDSAVQVFAERGYQAASMSEIAARAGVVASVIYDHFPGKRELYVELLELHGRELIERSIRLIPGASPYALVRAAAEGFFEFVEEDPFVWRFIFRDPPPDPEADAVYRRVRGSATEAIAAIIDAVAPPGEVLSGVERSRAIQMLAEASRASTDGLAGWWYEHREVPREEIVEAATQQLWLGLGGLLERGR